MDNTFQQFKNKTRVLLLTSQSPVPKLVQEILNFYHKDSDFYVEENSENLNSDFVILETSDIQKATLFEPNIVLITSEIVTEDIIPLLTNITPGGVLIHHSNLAEIVDNSANFFRKLEFTESQVQKSNDSFTLQTNIGAIPVSTKDELLIKNLEGIKLLVQQFGVMEEEFYEPVMSFK